MCSFYEFLFLCVFLLCQCVDSYHEQFRVPHKCTRDVEIYLFGDKEYILHNLPVTWENAKILCKGYHNGTLAILDTKERAEFIAEALSESQFELESVWLGARRNGAQDPAGYRWEQGTQLRRTAVDVMSDDEKEMAQHYPMWMNRTHVPVPEGGADCVALERVFHDRPVFVDLPCGLDRPFVCEREARQETKVSELKAVRCRTGVYHVFDGRLTWNEAAAFCVLRKMALANIGTMRCLKKLGLTMLKNRPSIENAWVGAKGVLGKWWWLDTGLSIFAQSPYSDVPAGMWPPMRDRTSLHSDGCLQLDRHNTHPPVFLEARCERRMAFICYQNALNSTGVPLLRTAPMLPSDDNYYYVLVRELYEWQQAYENCLKMNGTLASVETHDVLIQLLLIMGENKDQPIDHIWMSGRLNMSRDPATDVTTISWFNPTNRKKIPDSKDSSNGEYIPPWLDEEFTMDSPCLNLDRQDHLQGLLYGLACDTLQSSICMIEKSMGSKPPAPLHTVAEAGNLTTGQDKKTRKDIIKKVTDGSLASLDKFNGVKDTNNINIDTNDYLENNEKSNSDLETTKPVKGEIAVKETSYGDLTVKDVPISDLAVKKTPNSDVGVKDKSIKILNNKEPNEPSSENKAKGEGYLGSTEQVKPDLGVTDTTNNILSVKESDKHSDTEEKSFKAKGKNNTLLENNQQSNGDFENTETNKEFLEMKRKTDANIATKNKTDENKIINRDRLNGVSDGNTFNKPIIPAKSNLEKTTHE